MASTLKHLRSSTADKRPTASGLVDGQLAINTASGTPAVFFKDSNGGVVKVGPAHVGASAPNAVPAGSAGNSLGELWVDNSLTTPGLNYYTGSAFVNLTPSGTTTTVGLVELATPAETQAGTDAVRAVTPSGLQSKVSDSTSTTSSTTIASSTAVKSAYDLANAALPKAGGTVTGELLIGTTGSLVFEGSSDDSFETTIAVVDPTSDRTITFPNISGTVVTTGDSGTVTSTMIADATIVDGDISPTAEIAVSKLADGAARQLLQTDAAGTGVEWASNIDIPGTLDVTSAATFDSSVAVTGALTKSGNNVVTVGDTGTVTSTMILDGTILNEDINASAAIVDTKLATISTADKVSLSALNIDGGTDIGTALADADLFIVDDGGAGANRKAAATRITDYAFGKVSGDITIGSTGTAAIGTGVIVNADVNASAAIAGTKISPDFGSQTVVTTGVFSHALGAAATPSITFTGDLNTGIYSPGADQVAVATNGTGRLFISSTGLVGVGTSSPAELLHLSGTSNPSIQLTATNDTTPIVNWASNGTDRLQISSSSVVGANINVRSNQELRLSTNNTERLRITAAGLVGVGTSAPNVALTVREGAVSAGALIPNADIAFPASFLNGFFRAVGGYQQGAGTGGTIQLGGKSYTDVGSVGAFLISAISSSNATDALTFSTQTSFNNVVSEKMRLDSSGRLGVGTTSPARTLDVNGSIQLPSNNAVYINGSSNYLYADTSTTELASATSIKFVANSAERVRITSAGLVGIGTSAPQSELNIAKAGGASTVYIESDAGNNATTSILRFGGASGRSASIQGFRGASSNIHSLDFYTYNSADAFGMRLTPTGLGIGITSPSTALQVVGTARFGDGTNGTVSLTSNSSTSFYDSLNNAATGWQTAVFRATTLTFATDASSTPTERARIDSSGRLLVGTSTSSSVGALVQVRAGAGNNHIEAIRSSDDAGGPAIWLTKSRGTAGSPTEISNGDQLGFIVFRGHDGVDYKDAAYIYAEADGTWTDGGDTTDNPSRLVFSTTADGASSPTERMRITNTGFLKASNTGAYNDATAVGTYHELISNIASFPALTITSRTTSLVSDVFSLGCFRSASTAFNCVRLFSGDGGTNAYSDVEFTLRGDGNAFADGSWTGGGADYAEYFEWSDSNPDAEDRRGISVVLDVDKIRQAVAGEDPIGVISGNPSVVGDAAWNKWTGKYLRDEFGTYIQEDYEVEDEDGNTVVQQRRKLNPAYDPDVEYIPREQRPEWDCVGLMGKLRIRKGQVTGSRWIKMRDINDSVEEWLVR